MAIKDYRLNPFLNVFEVSVISGETHKVSTSSPYTIRLNEVPQKTDPSSLIVKYSDGTVLTEVAAQPSAGQYWPDYNTTAHGVDDWNTGTLLFNAADAGKTVTVSYNGLGTLTDERLLDMAEISVTTSTQPEREAIVDSITSSYDSTMESNSKKKKYWATHTRGRLRTHTGITAGTYTLQSILQKLVNLTHTHEYVKDTWYSECVCDCSDDGS